MKMKNPNKNFRLQMVALFVIVAVSALAISLTTKQRRSEPSSSGHIAGKTYYLDSYADGNTYYNCSKPVKLIYHGSSLGPGRVYSPVNQDEATKYCRSDGTAIEYRAVLDILKRSDIDKLVSKYNSTQVTVRALGHKYIHDIAYLDRILPAYSSMKIDCVIVVHSPEGTRFFLENGEKHESHNDHQYLEIPAHEFLASLNNAPDSDITAFWLGLH